MHKTFYIDVDEEITSIVDRIKKAKVKEIIIVAPKRALLIGSIVNLKLLKKEADTLGAQVTIVTQDKLGKMLIEKAGILAQDKLDEEMDEEILVFEDQEKEKENLQEVKAQRKTSARERLSSLGSAGFYDSAKEQEKRIKEELKGNKKQAEGSKSLEEEEVNKNFEKIINRELVTEVSGGMKKRGSMDLSANKKKIKNLSVEEGVSSEQDQEEAEISKPQKNEGDEEKKIASFFLSRSKGDFQRKDFQENSRVKRKKEKINSSEVSLPVTFWKKFLIFSLLAILVLGFLGAYLFIPKAKITIFTDTKEYPADIELKASVANEENNIEQASLPVQVFNFEEEIAQNFPATGEKEISNQKARGVITIYNEYTKEAQPLVATTRFLTENGELFRLVEGVEIPGLTENNGEIEPGSIQAQVVADESGEEFNIGPATFSIPGFESSGQEKHSKFYAKSFESMTGGGGGNNKVATLTEGDISSAKEQILSLAKKEALEKIRNENESNSLILEEAVNFGETTYKTSHSVGEVTEEFTVTLALKAEVLLVSQGDLEEVSARLVEEKNRKENPTLSISQSNIVLEFGKADINFENKEMLLRIHAIGKAALDVGLDDLKNKLLGKSQSEVESLLDNYPEIEKITVDYWPPFISGKIPSYAKRVDIILDKNDQ